MSDLAFDNVATLLLLLVSLTMIYLTASGTRTCSHDSFICTSKEAFDTVDHNIFLLKLKAAGVSGIALSWFQSYLASRCERTCNDDR